MVYDSAQNFEKMSKDIFIKIKNQIQNGEARLSDRSYYEELAAKIEDDNTNLIVRKDNEIFYTTNAEIAGELIHTLPAHGFIEDEEQLGYYYNMGRKSIKQLDFVFEDGAKGSIFIVARNTGIVSKKLLLDMTIAIIIIMIFTSIMLTQWIQKGVLNPVKELNVAMQRIAEGNLF